MLAALVGPVAIGWLAGVHGRAHGGSGQLLARFALVVLAPLASASPCAASGRAATGWPGDDERDGIAALTVIVLVYASLSGTQGSHGLGSAFIASVCFCAGSALLGWAWHARAAHDPATADPSGALTIGMRDFAVAAALASRRSARARRWSRASTAS